MTRCNTQHDTATLSKTLQHMVLRCVAVCYRVLQYSINAEHDAATRSKTHGVAVCCSVLQSVAIFYQHNSVTHCNTLQHRALDIKLWKLQWGRVYISKKKKNVLSQMIPNIPLIISNMVFYRGSLGIATRSHTTKCGDGIDVPCNNAATHTRTRAHKRTYTHIPQRCADAHSSTLVIAVYQ